MKRERNIMNNPSDTLKSKVKTIHELSKEFPEKTYRELEKYRDADRNEEAQRIITQQENEELKEDQHKENWEEKYNLAGIFASFVNHDLSAGGYPSFYKDNDDPDGKMISDFIVVETKYKK